MSAAAAVVANTAAPVAAKVEALDLAALLCSRVCHDLISPVGAIVNGLEVMEDDNDQETKAFALELIKKSVRTASARLQFCRLAFGAAGSAPAGHSALWEAHQANRVSAGQVLTIWSGSMPWAAALSQP